ncbi:MAG TPA: hypothetical protein PKL49_07630 [Steroidobacteraceae bacterium]|nr:hypothetical protein [Steroidobacteraceae bacterium]
MTRATFIAPLLLASLLAGCQQASQEPADVSVDLNQVKSDLETLSQARVYFAHQSVGRNMLKGIEMLVAETGVALHIEEVKDGIPASPGPGLYHANVGENGVADSKISAFVADVTAPGPAAYDVALLKFCYTDLSPEAEDQDPRALLERYESTVAGLRAQQPNLTLLHTTMPLRAEPPGWKTRVKRLIGKEVISDRGNIMRGEYNELLRSESSPADLFDVARLEATHLDGTIATFKANGRQVEVLAPEHTYDGGHLNDPAKRYFAADFLHALAQAVRQRPAPVETPTETPSTT